ATAVPFRVSMERGSRIPTSAKVGQTWGTKVSDTEAEYIAAALKYWDGDFAGAIASFQQLRATQPSAAAGWMLYLAWTKAEANGPAVGSVLDEIVRRSPEALAAEYELAARAKADDRTDDALAHLEKVLEAQTHFVPAQDLMGQIAVE